MGQSATSIMDGGSVSGDLGLQANNLRVLPQFRRTLQEQELLADEAAGVDALVAV